ncbi:MAG TPA: murein biosynthesis integral membrane protein MurJ [Planctomycetota bacterium]|nr:murein biosynthesis integral membrane protein MurJ [Planctomycetota bacterium]
MTARPSVRRSAIIIGVCTLVSRILGMGRDILCFHIFGAGMVWDAFVIAWRIPNLFRRLFGEGALTGAFVPPFVRLIEAGRRDEAFALLNRVLTMLVLFLGGITLLGVGASFVLPLLWPDEKTKLVSSLVRILLWYVPLVCVGAMVGAALNGLFRFFAPAFAPIVLNITWLVVLPIFVLKLHFTESQAIHAISWAILGGAILQLLTMAVPLARVGMRYRPAWAPRDEGLREVGRLFLPSVFGLSLVQINELVDTLIAEIFVPGHGAVSAIYSANLLTQFPLSLVGTSIATAILPGLSAAVARNDPADFGALLRRGLSGALYLGLPASAGLALFGTEIIAVIFEHGQFTAEATARAGLCTSYFGVGLWCYCVNQVQVRAFHAHKDTRSPVRVSAAMVALNLALNFALVGPMREAGLALATSITGLVTFVVLNRLLRRRLPGLDLRPIRADFVRSLAATAVMGAAAWAAMRWVGPLLPPFGPTTLGTRALPLALAIAVGMAVYFGITRLMGMPDALTLLRRRR